LGKEVQLTHAYFGRLSVSQQIAFAAQSDLVIAPHGGGEGWMAVMPKGAVLVELRHQGASRCFVPYARFDRFFFFSRCVIVCCFHWFVRHCCVRRLLSVAFWLIVFIVVFFTVVIVAVVFICTTRTRM
jgi:hypothetical protein